MEVIEQSENAGFEKITDTETEVKAAEEIETAEADTQQDVREEPSCESEEFRVETFTITM